MRNSDKETWIVATIFGSLFLSIVFIAVMTPHWMRHTGQIVKKIHVDAWTKHFDAWTEHHPERHIYHEEWTEKDGTGKKPVYIVHPAYTEVRPAYDEFHEAYDKYCPAINRFQLQDGYMFDIDEWTFNQAKEGDYWAKDGFYGTKLEKNIGPEK